MINLELYRCFYTVARLGSLTAAAKELFVTQPALSQSILRLEEQLGGRLFVRTSKGMSLTPEGNAVFEYVEKGLNMFGLAQNSFEESKNLISGTIRIGASDTLCRHFLLKYIRKFHEEYPYVKISVTNRTTNETIDLLKAGSVDVAFINLPVSQNGLVVRNLLELHDCIVSSRENLPRKTVSKQELSKMPLIMMERLSNTRRYFDKYMQTLGVVIQPEIELGSFDLVVEFAKAGIGYGCVTKEFIGDELENSNLFEIETAFKIPPRAIGCATLPDIPPSFAAGKFLEFIEYCDY